MRQCLLPYFNAEEFSGDLKLNKNSFQDISELEASVETMLEGDLPFRIDTDQGDTDYEDSINQLIQTLYSKVGELDLQFEFNAAAKRELSRFIKSIVLPKPLTKTEKLIQANIAGSDLITEDQRQDIKFGTLVRSIYEKGTSPLNNTRQNAFNNAMMIRTIIDSSKRKLVTNETELNSGLISYQTEQYNLLKDYLTSLGYNLSDYNIPANLYHIDNSTKIQTLTKGYNNIYTLMYNVIGKAKRDGTFEQDLEDGWNNYILGNKDISLYKAVNAYINLAYFDNVLKQCFGDYIQINGDYDAPITAIKEDAKPIFINKYTFAKGNKNATKTWGVEDHDSLKEMAKFSQILIRSIPVYEYNTERLTESESFGNMETKDFVNTISKLLDLSSSIPNQDIQNAICNFQLQPRDSIVKMFSIIFDQNNKSVLRELANNGFDQNYINYLYSIYRQCFKGSNSWDAIEQKYIRNYGVPDTYPIIDTILGIMNSNVANNFLQTTYNSDTGKMETTVKKKYNDRRTKFDIVNNVNSVTIDRQNKAELVDKYQLSNTGRNYSITLTAQGNSIKFGFIPSNDSGILDKGLTSSKLSISNMPDLSAISLDNINSRSRLISGSGLTDNEAKFMSILQFIDRMLSTNFSSDQDGLRKLSIMQRLSNNNFKELFAAATRALVVTDLYNKFETATKDDGTKYSKLELIQFMNDKNPYYDSIQALNNRLRKQYFISRFDGQQLSTLYPSQKWLDDLSTVEAILSGETSKSVISNLDGDKIPNFSPQFLGARIEQQLTTSRLANNATSNLLFVQNRQAIKSKVVNTDVLTKDGIRKQIKNMTSGELIYDSIVNKFFTPYLQEKTIYSQPTTYSDKTKFLLYGINLDTLGIKSLIGKDFDTQIETLLSNTIGKTYIEVWDNVLDDYAKFFEGQTVGNQNVPIVQNGKADIDRVAMWMKNHSVDDLLNLVKNYNTVHNTNLVIYKDTHYREVKLNGGVHPTINELLFDYANNLYTPENLHRRLQKEKINFLNDLLSNRVSFKVQKNPESPSELMPLAKADEITSMLIKLLGPKAINWVDGSYMVLAKATKNGKTRNVLYGDVDPDETVELNPVLNAYFMLDNLVGNNLRMSLTGSEINHKVKALKKWSIESHNTAFNLYKPVIRQLNPYYDGQQLSFFDVQRALNNYDNLKLYRQLQEDFNNADPYEAIAIGNAMDQIDLPIRTDIQVDDQIVQTIRNMYESQIYTIENGAQNAQFKRNVIIPGTMRPYTPNCINGIGSTIKVAVVNDVGAKVFNFDGKSDNIDAHDGSAWESPITSRLENNALQDSEVGMIKKPIHHWYDDRYSTATLLKYAVDTITNQWMRQSEGNDLNNDYHGISLRNVFKKMHNVRWSQQNLSRGIDLIDGCDYKEREDIPDFHSIDFNTDILNGHQLFYKKGDQDVNILDFGRENGIYYTIEQDVDIYGNKSGEPHKVYHYFNDSGEHFPSNTILDNPVNGEPLHTIDSLFELHTALGGIYSESLNTDNELQYSEASNIAVTNFVNSVAYKKNQSDIIDQNSYYQPLKEMMVDVVANNSAVKNGAGNINSSDIYYDNNPLQYMTLGTSQYGIQMDADHTADEGKMTEFSQVISSLDAGGRLHDYVSQIYETLGEVAVQLSQIELDAVDAFRSGEGKSKMYDIIGRTIINNLSKSKGDAGLAEAIIYNIKRGFNLNTDHELDQIKIPFSDPNIYSTLLSTFVSIINKKSIKRQYPGQGTVMVPAYNLSMIYELDGKTYQFEDLVRMATEEGLTSNSSDISTYNKDIVHQYLQAKQNAVQTIDTFMPTDNVLIQFESGGQQKVYHASLNSIEDYYAFKDNITAYLNGKGFLNPVNITFKKDISIPRNLAPAKISWSYNTTNMDNMETEIHNMNIFDHWRIKGLFQELNRINNLKGVDKKQLQDEARKTFNPQQAFDELDKGLYIDENNNQFKIYNFKSESAELIMSNLYKSKFNLKEGDSLAQVTDIGYRYFLNPANLISSTNYDMAFTKQNGKHLYLTFKPIWQSSDTFDSHRKEWSNIIRKDFTYPEDTPDNEKKIIHKVYATTKDNLQLFEVGREILRDDILWDPDKKKFTQKGKVLRDQSKYIRYGEDKVLEYIEFLSQYNVQEEIDGKVNKYTAYNINRSAIKRVLYQRPYTQEELTRTKDDTKFTITADQKFNEEVNNFISTQLLAKIYESSDFNGVQLNSQVTPESHTIIKNTLYSFGSALGYDPELSSYLKDGLLKRVLKAGPMKDGVITYKKLNGVVNNYRMAIAKKQYASFLKSQSFTASRIPAQTLQSFMQMHCVGFTGTANNQCFVSHWQTWLQGSDY